MWRKCDRVITEVMRTRSEVLASKKSDGKIKSRNEVFGGDDNTLLESKCRAKYPDFKIQRTISERGWPELKAVWTQNGRPHDLLVRVPPKKSEAEYRKFLLTCCYRDFYERT